ncbi:hypothetical protein LOD99_15565 [Oopsacas minuta]|uniref:HAT C-terminal dimerisation domain-containing protein n=1 Tax=Oopsacas minuta TaxID=111878 RepID=A0AAV7KA60_9METZ|nr:hypothetical protein LOD99_15565 [Oopsacas minuta]
MSRKFNITNSSQLALFATYKRIKITSEDDIDNTYHNIYHSHSQEAQEPDFVPTCDTTNLVSSDPIEETTLPNIAQGPNDKPVQPNRHTRRFPSTLVGTKKRQFNPDWFVTFSWLEYSVERDAGFCSSYHIFNAVSGRTEDAFKSVGLDTGSMQQEEMLPSTVMINALHTSTRWLHGMNINKMKGLVHQLRVALIRQEVDDKANIHERFLTFVDATSLTAESLTTYLISTLNKHGLDRACIVSQGYDGAAVMSGNCHGVQQRMKEIYPYAMYIHCYAHRVNLVLVDCVKKIQFVCVFFLFLRLSVYSFLPLKHIRSSCQCKRSFTQRSKILTCTKSLSDYLQSPQVNLANATDLVSSTVSTLGYFRTDEEWEKIFRYSENVARSNNIDITKYQEPRQRRLPQHLKDFTVFAPTGTRESLSNIQQYKVNLYFPILDTFLEELNRRFSKGSTDIMMAIHSFNPQSEYFMDPIRMESFALFYNLEYESLRMESILAKRTLGNAEMKSIDDLFLKLLPLRDAFPTLLNAIQISLTISISTAQCERSFSALKRIKTYLRSTMSEQWLTDLAIIAIVKELTSQYL